MKKIFYISSVLVLLLSCNKKEVTPINFNVTTSATTYKVGDSVIFNFTGNPDFITFYSGEAGHQYQYSTRDFATGGVPIMQFNSYRQYGVDDSTLHILISTNFTGSYTTGGVDSATWKDITNRAILSTGTDQTPSGAINLSDFVGEDNSPLYIAFKYRDTSKNGTSSLRTWTITNFVLNTTFSDSTVASVATLSSASWKDVTYITSTAAWIISTTSLKINGGAAGGPENHNWVISGSLYPNRVSPDTGVVLKNMTVRLSNYTYVFSKAGTYNVTFSAVNENIYGRQQVIKTIPITVNP